MADLTFLQAALPVLVTDENNSVLVTPGSTAAIASSAALTVAVSPNSPASVIQPTGTNLHAVLDSLPSSTDTSGSGTLGALNATVQVTIHGKASGLLIISGTWVGTIQIQGLAPDGTTYSNLSTQSVPAGIGVYSSTAISTNGVYRLLAPSAYTQIQALMATYTSGTATVSFVFSEPASTVQTVQLTAGNLITASSPIDGYKASYSAATVELAVATAATDIFTITGSSTKTVRVTLIEVSQAQTSASDVDFLVIKRSAADTSGTSTSVIAVPHDSNNAAATATVRSYTANPTLGAGVGIVASHRYRSGQAIPSSGTLPAIPSADENAILFAAARPAQAIVLRGTSEVLAVNMNSGTATGNYTYIKIEWTEES